MVTKPVSARSVSHQQLASHAMDSKNTSGGNTQLDGEDAYNDRCTFYSIPWCIQNTFISCPIDKSASVEGFLKERNVRSAPSSRAHTPCDDAYKQVINVTAANMEMVRPPMNATTQLCQRVKGFKGRNVQNIRLNTCATANSSKGTSSSETSSRADNDAQLEFPSRELLNVGSRGHHLRKCKPCAFLYSVEGCNNGANCEFCHLCDSGEVKRRRQERKQRQRNHERKHRHGACQRLHQSWRARNDVQSSIAGIPQGEYWQSFTNKPASRFTGQISQWPHG